MAENKKSFIAYVDWKETFDSLPDEKAGQLVKHLFAYVSDENPETDDILIKAVFANIKHQLKRDLKKWESLSAQRTEIGRLGGIKSGKTRSKMKQTKQMVKSRSKTKQNEHDNVNVNVNDNVINKREYKFTLSVFEFKESYPKEMLNKFINYWTEKNKSKTKMRWELEKTFEISKRLATWASRDNTFTKTDNAPKTYEEMLSLNDKNPGIFKQYKMVKENGKLMYYKND